MFERLISRPQGLLRSWFGLGPSQFTAADMILPTYDVDALMRGPQDTIIRTGSALNVVPGTVGIAIITLPARGNYLLDAVS